MSIRKDIIGNIVMENGAELRTKQVTFKPETYDVEGAKVQLRWTETSPKESKDLDPRRGIVWLSAWNWMPEVKIIKDISQKVADNSGQKVFTLSSKTDQLGEQTGPIEAKGIVTFLSERGLSEVIIIGHSEGGMKAIDLTAELQKTATTIDGLVLIDSMGLYDQDPRDLRKKFLGDRKVAKGEFESTGVTPPKGGTMQMLYGIWQDLKFFGITFRKKFKEEIRVMASLNPRLKEIKTPVLIITGDKDYVSDHRSYIPEEEINRRVDKNAESRQVSKQEEMLRRGKARREFLKENMLPNSENVAMLVTSKGAHHAGSTDIRINQVAHVASKIFERMRRPVNAASL